MQSGIREVVYLEDKYADTDLVKASKKLFDSAGILYRQFIPPNSRIVIDLSREDASE